MEFERHIKPRPLLILAELFLLLAVLTLKFHNVSIAFLGASTVLYYIGMRQIVGERLGKWALKRFTVAYLIRGLSWVLMIASAVYTYSAVIENVFPIGPAEFVVTSIVALIGAILNYLAVGIRNSVLWRIEGLRKSLWISRLNSLVLFLMALIPFIPSLKPPEEVKVVLETLSLPVLGSFTLLAILGKAFYIRFLLTMKCPEKDRVPQSSS